MANSKIPITVVTGFLGAGKTTLVNHILKGNHGRRIAVIENEFGEVGIDDALVMETKEEIFEMNNGCICCTVRGDLIRILNKLLKRRNKFDAIMIETTGLANPAPVIQTFFVDDDLKEACSLDAVLTVVDTKHVMLHLDEVKEEGVVNEAVQQVAFADKILLNKLDLVTPQEKATVVARIKAMNPGVGILECTNAQVDVDKVLGIGAFSMEKMLQKDPEFLEEDDHHHHHDDHHDDHDHHDHHDHEHEHEHGEHHSKESAAAHGSSNGHHAPAKGHHLDHKHDSHVTSVGIQVEGSVDMKKLNGWLSKLLQERGGDLYRSKGIVSVDGSSDKFVFQGVHMLLQFSSSAEGVGQPWQEGEKRVCKLVFIGRDLNRQELNEGFAACLAGSTAEQARQQMAVAAVKAAA